MLRQNSLGSNTVGRLNDLEIRLAVIPRGVSFALARSGELQPVEVDAHRILEERCPEGSVHERGLPFELPHLRSSVGHPAGRRGLGERRAVLGAKTSEERQGSHLLVQEPCLGVQVAHAVVDTRDSCLELLSTDSTGQNLSMGNIHSW